MRAQPCFVLEPLTTLAAQMRGPCVVPKLDRPFRVRIRVAGFGTVWASASRHCGHVTPKNKYGRLLGTHIHETFFREMNAELDTPQGRARRRARIPIEHALARVGQIQSRRAGFVG